MKTNPTEGDRRVVCRFSFFPVKVEGKWLFWDWYYAKQEYRNYYYTVEVDVGPRIFNLCTHETRSRLMWQTYDKKLR